MAEEMKRQGELTLAGTAQYFFDEAAKQLRLEEGMVELLRYPKRELIVNFPARMDDGRVEHFVGYRVQHHPVLGPCKGGIRFHPDVTLEEVEGLALLMTWKTSLMNLPLSGAKGGVRCDPKNMSVPEVERVTRRYAAEISPLIGPDLDIPAPDVYTGPREMAWIVDTISMHRNGEFMPGLVTGKPIVLGGSLGRDTATARGGYFTTLESLKHLKLDIGKMTVAVQGFGNAGWHMAHFLHDGGAKIVALSDSKGGIYNAKGLDPYKVFDFKQQSGTVVGFRGADKISNDDLLKLKYDILVPSALENQITEHNANKVRAKLIVELANGPTTVEADEILSDQGAFIVPDFLANGGGVTVSYFEWVQDRYRYFWSAEMVDERLKQFMTTAFQKVLHTHLTHKVTTRLAAFMTAVERVAEGARARGFYA
jgi:glutamate dehydrogenase/leucine dehydrogenase